MLPTIVIGIGGTGKWVLTDVKKNLVDTYGEVPEEVSILEFDLLVPENKPVIRQKFDLEQGKQIDFTLDYDTDHDEFFNFCGELTDVIDSAKKGEGKYPFIEKWFKKEEAEKYVGKIGTCEGAGQFRPLSRSSLFIKSQDIYSKIKEAVRRIVSKRSSDEVIPVFIVSSLAGGTGCGTFIDFASLVHKCFKDLYQANVQYHIFGIFILPRGFVGTLPGADQQERFNANCFSAFREMHRFNSIMDQKMEYNAQINIKKDFPLYDIVYFVDGTGITDEKGNQVSHDLGLCPAIAEFIITYTEETAPIGNLPNIIIGGIRKQFDPRSSSYGSLDIPIYSTFGIHKYIFEINDLKIDFAHRIGKDVLSYFIEEPSFAAYNEVQNFMKRPTATPLLRDFLYQSIENPGLIGTDKKFLIGKLKFNSENEDIEFPVMRTDDIPTGSILKPVPFSTVKAQADRRAKNVIGSVNDMASPSVQERSTYGVLNYYIGKHKEKFIKALEDYLIQNILNPKDRDRKGSLLKSRYFLTALIETLDKINERIEKMFKEVRVEDEINRLQKEISKAEAKGNNKKYLEQSRKLVDAIQHKYVMDSIIKTLREEKEICNQILTNVENWIHTFDDGIKQINNSQKEHIKTRQSKRNIKCWTFVTEPEDETENRIYELMRGSNPKTPVEGNIKEKLPSIKLETLTDPNKYFVWAFKAKDDTSNEQIQLSCSLPEEFAPLESLRNEPIKWNYNFVNNYLILGNLDGLKNLTIMDAFVLKGLDPAEVAKDLRKKSTLLANIDENAQAQGNDNTRNVVNVKQTLASFVTTPPGNEFATKFNEEINKVSGNQAIPLREDIPPHMILQLSIANFIKYSGFTGLTMTQEKYKKIAVNGGYHVFPEEVNALKIESKFEAVFPGEPQNFLNCKVVNLLGDLELIRSFAYALKEKWIDQKLVSGEYTIDMQVQDVAETKSYTLGRNKIEVLEFLTKEDTISKKAREKIMQKMNELTNKIDQGEIQIESFVEGLTEFYRRIDPSSEDNSVEKDLLKVIKVIIYEDIRKFKERKKGGI
jgi:hypothetical protein